MTDTVWAPDGSNLVVHADNAAFLPTLPDGAFTLIYVDPPFNTGRVQRRQETRMVRNADGEGDRLGFKGRSYDTIKGALHSYDDAFSDYWSFLEPRLLEAWRLLSEDGTLYLHLDYREVHYAKVMLDAIFGRECFLNEIIWAYDYGARARNRWPTKHDNILVYVKNPAKYHFDNDEVDREPYMAPGLVTEAKRKKASCPRTSGGTPSCPRPARRRPVTRRRSPKGWCAGSFRPQAGPGTGALTSSQGPGRSVRSPGSLAAGSSAWTRTPPQSTSCASAWTARPSSWSKRPTKPQSDHTNPLITPTRGSPDYSSSHRQRHATWMPCSVWRLSTTTLAHLFANSATASPFM